MDKLAKAIENLAQNRAPSRQAVELPIFSGAITEWLPFKAAMRDSSLLCKFSRSENLARLRNCLKGEARESVAALLYTANDPEIIMKTLEQRFGRTEMLVDRALNEIKKLPRPSTTTQDLNTFAVKLQNIVCVLTTVDDRGYVNNPMLAREITEKLSPHLRSRWCDYAEEYGSRDQPEIVALSQFLMREAERALRHAYVAQPTQGNAAIAQTTTGNARNNNRRTNERKAVYAAEGTTEKTASSCLCCGGNHDVPRCDKYLRMSVSDRWDWLKRERLCFQCVNAKHRRNKCTRKECGVNQCSLYHHPSLHHTDKRAEATTRTAVSQEEPMAVMSTAATNSHCNVLLKVCRVFVATQYGFEIETYALMDEGSTVSLIDSEFARKIGADGPESMMHVHGINSTQRESSKRINLKIRGIRSSQYEDISLRTINKLSMGNQTVSRDCLTYEHLRELDAEDVCFDMARPTILIGADNWHLIVSRRLLVGGKREPAASMTELGWVIHGTVPRLITQSHENGVAVLHVRSLNNAVTTDDCDMHERIKAHFEIDALGINKTVKLSSEERRACEIFDQTVKCTNNQYEVGLPWRADDIALPPSYTMALSRLRSIERKMTKSPAFTAQYEERMNDLLQKEYAVKCEKNESMHKRAWWLPHFAVTNPNKPGKIRLVFDAAAKSNNVSLNDALLDGPDLLKSLNGILYRFREKAVAIAADIREMFLRIKIRKEDQPSQLFLWRSKTDQENDQPPTQYKMASMIFGARSSPFLAHSVRNHNAEMHKQEYPLAHYAITQSHYMDDLVDSYDSEEEARRVVEQVLHVHARAGFHMASWNGNSQAVLESVPSELRADGEVGRTLAGNAHMYEKTLGLKWRATTDTLSFNTVLPRVKDEIKRHQRAPTKREALSAVMSLFDPLGLLSCYTVTAKICLQRIWRCNIGWDEAIPEEIASDFTIWLTSMNRISELRLERCYFPKGKELNNESLQLHVFCDASEEAYAAAAYWRLEQQNDTKTTLVAAKARVAPLRTQSIPRLELQAALIGARLKPE